VSLFGQPQYTLPAILGIWLAATLPMGVLRYLVLPAALPLLPEAFSPGALFWLLAAFGTAWQIVLSALVLRREVRPFSSENIRNRLWLTAPIDPQSGRRRPILYLSVVPVLAYWFAMDQTGVLAPLRAAVLRFSPGLGIPAYAELEGLLRSQQDGSGWLTALALAGGALCTLAGGELLFRGVLLPRMGGVFGRFDWLANAALFAASHVHAASEIPVLLVSNLLVALPSRVFRSSWISVIARGADGIVMIVLVLRALGL
jgi:membrane protease YdiL (CAAX protease family)